MGAGRWAPPAPGTYVPGGSGTNGITNAVTSTKRGYTGHEQVEEFGFIHMNGRIYDAEVGKFLSADPTMQFPESTQGFNNFQPTKSSPPLVKARFTKSVLAAQIPHRHPARNLL